MCPEGLLLVLTVHLLVLLQLPFLITRAWCKYMEAVQPGLLQPRLRLLPQSLLTQNINSIRSGNNKLRGRMKRYHHLIEHAISEYVLVTLNVSGRVGQNDEFLLKRVWGWGSHAAISITLLHHGVCASSWPFTVI